MLSPEERKAYSEWRRKQYHEHFQFVRQVRNAIEKGIPNAQEYVIQKRKEELLQKETEATNPWARMQRLAQERKQRYEKQREKKEQAEKEKLIKYLSTPLEEEFGK